MHSGSKKYAASTKSVKPVTGKCEVDSPAFTLPVLESELEISYTRNYLNK